MGAEGQMTVPKYRSSCELWQRGAHRGVLGGPEVAVVKWPGHH